MNAIDNRVALVCNPAAGRIRRDPAIIGRLASALTARGFEPVIFGTKRPGQATELAAQALDAGIGKIMVCGGDGTVNDAAQALVGAEALLAVWPGGTANILAGELKLPESPEEAAALLASGVSRRLSVGAAVKPGGGWKRYFLLMAGIGLDAAVVDGVDLELKKRAGIGAYVASGLRYLLRMPVMPFSLEFDGRSHEGTFAVIANSARYAVWFNIAPGARIDDDKLNLCLFNSRSRLRYLSYALLSLRGAHTRSPGVTCGEVARVAAAGTGQLVQLDGDVVGRLPMSFESVPNALTIAVAA